MIIHGRPYILLISAILIFLVGLFSFQISEQKSTSSTLKITTSFYPLAEFARQVGGEFVDVTSLTPPGIEPHDFEPSPQAITSIYNSKIFLYNGGGVDTWATQLVQSLTDVKTVRMGDVIQSSMLVKSAEGVVDDHYWLSPTLAGQQVEAILEALIEVDPLHKDYYQKKAGAYLASLRDLDHAYKTGLASCNIRVVVTSHEAFGYLANEYQFKQIAITGVSPDEEPSAGTLASIAEQAKTQGVNYVFFETLLSPKLSQTLADELGAKTLVFNPIEGLTTEEVAQGKNYLSLMKENLSNLRTAMSCQ